MGNIYIIILVSVILIISFLFLVYYDDIVFYFKNLANTTLDTTPSDCPDYWIKYNNHKNDPSAEAKYGCYVDAKSDPDIVYNGGKCNYLNGERTNFGSMPNYCDITQVPGTANSFLNNLSTSTNGVHLIDGWQSFFKNTNLPAIISITPQHNKTWSGAGAAATGGDDYDAGDTVNDDITIRYVVLYEYTDISDTATSINFMNTRKLQLDNKKLHTGPSYPVTGLGPVINAYDNGYSLLTDNEGMSMTARSGTTPTIHEASHATTIHLDEYATNLHKCGQNSIDCPSTWSAETPNLKVDTSFVLIYIGDYVTGGAFDSSGYYISVYDKLTTSYIEKSTSDIITTIQIDGEDILDDLKVAGVTVTQSSMATSLPNSFIGYLRFSTPPYNPKTNNPKTVAGYSMDVFDNLTLCQKRTWAVKNDIKWSGITDNPTLSEKCNESDFFSPVDFNVDFTLDSLCTTYDSSAAALAGGCAYPTYIFRCGSGKTCNGNLTDGSYYFYYDEVTDAGGLVDHGYHLLDANMTDSTQDLSFADLYDDITNGRLENNSGSGINNYNSINPYLNTYGDGINTLFLTDIFNSGAKLTYIDASNINNSQYNSSHFNYRNNCKQCNPLEQSELEINFSEILNIGR